TSSRPCSTTPPPPTLKFLTDLASLPISEMREHLRRELAHKPTPGPAHRIPIRLSNDEYTRAHAAAQNLEPGSTTASPTPSNNPNSRVQPGVKNSSIPIMNHANNAE
ncbi:hypothetical protein K2Z90_008053, partial (plasmid) [Rhodococcus opacus PD630]